MQLRWHYALTWVFQNITSPCACPHTFAVFHQPRNKHVSPTRIRVPGFCFEGWGAGSIWSIAAQSPLWPAPGHRSSSNLKAQTSIVSCWSQSPKIDVNAKCRTLFNHLVLWGTSGGEGHRCSKCADCRCKEATVSGKTRAGSWWASYWRNWNYISTILTLPACLLASGWLPICLLAFLLASFICEFIQM